MFMVKHLKLKRWSSMFGIC